MDASNPLSIVQAASPNLPTVPPTSGQAGAISAIQAPDVSALMPPAALQYQFNIQQSLLMQQYALAQQAAVKAATVKSAAEVAAARAAEISKQLEKKSQSSSTSKSTSRSPLRSKSKSKSKSRSRSRSKSRSLSPIRKRRARSNSLSPIRYRRDYHSSYRPREHYGYRGYNYRSYYRGGYNDYSRYRYGRERDYHYRRRSRSRGRRRSRTRSRSPRRDRSRGRRSQSVSPPAKNRSHTRSPRDLRKKSVSPHARRDGTKSRHTPMRSLSREEAVKSPSVSSGSINASPPAKSRSRSSSQVKDYNVDHSPPTEPSHELDEDRLAFMDRKLKKGSSLSRQSSSSPGRSLSVSLDEQSYRNASDKQRPRGEHRETVKTSSSDEHEAIPKRTSSDEHGSPGKRYKCKVDESEGWNKHPGGGRRIRKPTRSSNAIFHDDSESGSGDEILDDWRDDLKQVVKGKGISAYKDGEFDRLEERGRSEMDSSVKAIASDIELKHESVLHSASPAGHSDSAMAVEEQDVATDKGHGSVIVRGEDESPLGQRGHISVLENTKEVCDEGDQLEEVLDEDIVFEGPKPASPVCEQRMQKYGAGGTDIDGHSIDEESPSARRSAPEKKTTVSLRIAEDDNYGTKDSNRRHSREKKVKDRSRSRDGKKYEGELTKHEKRRDRHKKHRKKQKVADEESAESAGDRHKKHRKKQKNADEESAESDGARRRHKRKHRREEERVHKERKKRKHKHRTRSSSVSVEDSSSDSEGEVRSSSRRRKRGSKKRKAAKRDVLESPPLSASLG